jgi:hypothetical protein
MKHDAHIRRLGEIVAEEADLGQARATRVAKFSGAT